MVRKYRKAKGIMEAGVSSTYMQLRSRRIVYIRSEKTISGDNNGVSSTNLSSCCESNEFIDLEVDDKDGETETSTYQRSTKRKLFENLKETKEEEESMENCSSPGFESTIKESMENCSSPGFESTIKESSSNCCCSGKKSMEEMTKSTIESEIEDFFAEAEKKINYKFEKKYNFDFEKEKPLEGRYEWVKLE